MLIVDDASPDGSGDGRPRPWRRRSAGRRAAPRAATAGTSRPTTTASPRSPVTTSCCCPPTTCCPVGADPGGGADGGASAGRSGLRLRPVVHRRAAPAPATVRNWTVWSGHEWLRPPPRRARCFISSPEVVMRREALVQAGLYDPRLPHSGDLDMWLRTAAELGHRPGQRPGPGALPGARRQHAPDHVRRLADRSAGAPARSTCCSTSAPRTDPRSRPCGRRRSALARRGPAPGLCAAATGSADVGPTRGRRPYLDSQCDRLGAAGSTAWRSRSAGRGLASGPRRGGWPRGPPPPGLAVRAEVRAVTTTVDAHVPNGHPDEAARTWPGGQPRSRLEPGQQLIVLRVGNVVAEHRHGPA